jgi:hypothetical protein
LGYYKLEVFWFQAMVLFQCQDSYNPIDQADADRLVGTDAGVAQQDHYSLDTALDPSFEHSQPLVLLLAVVEQPSAEPALTIAVVAVVSLRGWAKGRADPLYLYPYCQPRKYQNLRRLNQLPNIPNQSMSSQEFS